jgi:S-adenosylmethionine/arginine decarboxylase-like enzyme
MKLRPVAVPVHKHLIIRAEVQLPPLDPEFVIEWLRDTVVSIGMKVLSGPHAAYVDVPGNEGVTGVVIIETSHLALHVWDHQDPPLLQLDVYTCGDFNPQIIFDKLKEFHPTKIEHKYLDREHSLKEISLGDAHE